MKTSIILCTRNRIDAPLCFLKSVARQSALPDELIIVDSSDQPLESHEEVRGQLLELAGRISVQCIRSEPGLTRQRNTGVRNAQGAILYFFDDDIVLEPDYLEQMNRAFADHPEYMGGMGTFTEDPPRTRKNRLMHLFGKAFLLQSNHGDGAFHLSGFPRHSFPRESFTRVKVVSGAIMAFRKEVFGQFQFDERLHDYCYMEDVDISKRVSDRYPLFHNPLARAEHRHAEGGRGDIFQNRKMYMFNHRYLFMKNFYGGNRIAIIAHLWSIVGLFLLAVVNFSRRSSYLTWKGYLAGLREFHRRREEMLR